MPHLGASIECPQNMFFWRNERKNFLDNPFSWSYVPVGRHKMYFGAKITTNNLWILYFPKYWDILSTYHTCPKIWTSSFYYLLMCLEYCCMYGKQCRLIRRRIRRHLIWVYTVCKGLSVPILRVITVCRFFSGCMDKCLLNHIFKGQKICSVLDLL